MQSPAQLEIHFARIPAREDALTLSHCSLPDLHLPQTSPDRSPQLLWRWINESHWSVFFSNSYIQQEVQAGRGESCQRGGKNRLAPVEVTKMPAQLRGTWVSTENESWETRNKKATWPFNSNTFIQKMVWKRKIVSERQIHNFCSISLMFALTQIFFS